jgi:hypothetical protein
MKLPRMKYCPALELVFEKTNTLEAVKEDKNELMQELESSKDNKDLTFKICDGIHQTIANMIHLNSTDDNAKILLAMHVDKLAYYGWLRYQMLMLKKEVAK